MNGPVTKQVLSATRKIGGSENVSSDILICSFCDNRKWVVGKAGVICSTCGFRLKSGLVLADVDKTNDWLREQLAEYRQKNAKKTGAGRR